MIKLQGYVASEIIHSSSITEIVRATRELDGARVVLKYQTSEYPSLTAIARCRHEYELLRSLDHPFINRALSLERSGNRLVIVTEDFDGVPLWNYFRDGERAPERFLGLAIDLARALAFTHEHGIIHKDINPWNVLGEPGSGHIKLIDFGISTLLSRESPDFKHPGEIEGTLAYMSPEQTGRMNRVLDARTDLYSAGVTFYALLAGAPPFTSQDPMELIHGHIALQPPPLCVAVPSAPQVICDIVDKLLAKSAEDRYQSAQGLVYDLEQCLEQWRHGGAIAPFQLGQRDSFPKFEVPQTLYGRAAEITTLLGAFDRVASGSPELMLVGGYSGIGKSSLVHEIHRPVVAKRGNFIAGKYDQYNRNVPYSALVQAFTEMVQYVLVEPPETIARWRAQVRSALGLNGRVVVDLVPVLEWLIGPQPAVPALLPTEAQGRLHATFRAFVQVFARPEHPLVLFLDDVQRADNPSLHLLESLLTSPQTQCLFVIAAYRDNEVDAAHPTMVAVEEIRRAGRPVHEIALGPLSVDDTNMLVAKALHCGSKRSAPLAVLLQSRTGGNPFFLVQTLRTLREAALLTLDADTGQWTYDLEQIRAKGLTDNVVELMASRLRKMPEATRRMLQLASCVGNQFDLRVLSKVSERSPLDTVADLQPALVEELIVPLTSGYSALYGSGSRPVDSDSAASHDLLNERFGRSIVDGEIRVRYRFFHDRVQQAAYALVPEAARKAEHLKIGRLLLASTPENRLDSEIFDVVSHLNIGLDLVADPAERRCIAQLNFRAGKRAKAAAAHKAGAAHFAITMQILDVDMWSTDYQLALDVHRERAECEYVGGNFALAEELAATAITQAASNLDKASLYAIRMQMGITQCHYPKALQVGLEVLRLLGYAVPSTAEDTARAFAEEGAKIAQWMKGQEIDEICDRPEMTDPEKRTVMDILMPLWATSYLAQDPQMSGYLAYLMMTTTLEYGPAPGSAFAYVLHGLMLYLGGDCRRGYQFGALGIRLNERYPDPIVRVRAGNIFANSINPYFNHLETNLKYYRVSIEIAPQVGEIPYGVWAAYLTMSVRTMKGDPLPEVIEESDKYRSFVSQTNDRNMNLAYDMHRQMVRVLQGLTPATNSLDDENFREAEYLAEYQNTQFHSGVLFYAVYRTGLHVIFGDYRAALETARLAETAIPYDIGFFTTTNHHFYQSLALAALYQELAEADRPAALAKLDHNLAKLRGWAETGPSNFAHRRDLVAAEVARCRGDNAEAAPLYDLSIDQATAGGFTHDAALAAELAAGFHAARGSTRAARAYLIDAHYAYTRWGANSKVAQLRLLHPDILSATAAAPSTRPITANSTIQTSSTASRDLDFATVMKAAQALSGEIEWTSLIDKLLHITMENAGARRGWLVLNEEPRLVVVATAAVGVTNTPFGQPVGVDDAPDLPAAIVRYVAQTRVPLVLGNAAVDGPFRAEPRVQSRGCKSVACVPLLRQGRLTGILFIENDLVSEAFTADRVETLQLLAAQAAISLENSTLYGKLEARVAERTLALEVSNTKLKDNLDLLRKTQQQLMEASRKTGMADVATSVLHNVGNVFNSVNVSAGFISDKLKRWKRGGLARVTELLRSHEADLARFLTEDDKGRRVPEYLVHLTAQMEHERTEIVAELETLQKNIDHIKVVISMQQSHARSSGGANEILSLQEVLDDALKFNLASYSWHGIDVVREYADLPMVCIDRHKMLQVVTNLLSNARHAIKEMPDGRGSITVRTGRAGGHVFVEIVDNGCGIPAENLAKIFNYGYTTKKDGHGFGLHSSACAAMEMHGTLTAQSAGAGHGATFRLALPAD